MKQVWVVDDDEEMGRAVGLLLKVLEYEVATFYNVRSAVKTLLIGRHPDLIVLNLDMPEVSGLDMVEFLRRKPELRKIPIVMLAAEVADSIVDQALALGADSYIVKPVTLEELKQAIDQAFEKHLTP